MLFYILFACLIFNFFIAYRCIVLKHNLEEAVCWIDEKLIEIKNIKNSDLVIDEFRKHIETISWWISQLRMMIIPLIGTTIVFINFINLKSIDVSTGIVLEPIDGLILALLQSGVFVIVKLLVKRSIKGQEIIKSVNDKVIVLTVMKKAERIIKNTKNRE